MDLNDFKNVDDKAKYLYDLIDACVGAKSELRWDLSNFKEIEDFINDVNNPTYTTKTINNIESVECTAPKNLRSSNITVKGKSYKNCLYPGITATVMGTGITNPPVISIQKSLYGDLVKVDYKANTTGATSVRLEIGTDIPNVRINENILYSTDYVFQANVCTSVEPTTVKNANINIINTSNATALSVLGSLPIECGVKQCQMRTLAVFPDEDTKKFKFIIDLPIYNQAMSMNISDFMLCEKLLAGTDILPSLYYATFSGVGDYIDKYAIEYTTTSKNIYKCPGELFPVTSGNNYIFSDFGKPIELPYTLYNDNRRVTFRGKGPSVNIPLGIKFMSINSIPLEEVTPENPDPVTCRLIQVEKGTTITSYEICNTVSNKVLLERPLFSVTYSPTEAEVYDSLLPSGGEMVVQAKTEYKKLETVTEFTLNATTADYYVFKYKPAGVTFPNNVRKLWSNALATNVQDSFNKCGFGLVNNSGTNTEIMLTITKVVLNQYSGATELERLQKYLDIYPIWLVWVTGVTKNINSGLLNGPDIPLIQGTSYVSNTSKVKSYVKFKYPTNYGGIIGLLIEKSLSKINKNKQISRQVILEGMEEYVNDNNTFIRMRKILTSASSYVKKLMLNEVEQSYLIMNSDGFTITSKSIKLNGFNLRDKSLGVPNYSLGTAAKPFKQLLYGHVICYGNLATAPTDAPVGSWYYDTTKLKPQLKLSDRWVDM